MRNIMLFFAALTLLSGCVTLETPAGYAETDRTGDYSYKAISTDANIITVKVVDNQDEKQGTLDYWATASRKQMTLSRGYELKEEGTFSCDQGPGRWFLFSRLLNGQPYLYLLGLVVDDDDIYVLESGGEEEYFKDDVKKVIAAFATLD